MIIDITKKIDGKWAQVHLRLPQQGGWGLLFNTRIDTADDIALRIGREIMRLLDDEEGNNVHHS